MGSKHSIVAADGETKTEAANRLRGQVESLGGQWYSDKNGVIIVEINHERGNVTFLRVAREQRNSKGHKIISHIWRAEVIQDI